MDSPERSPEKTKIKKIDLWKLKQLGVPLSLLILGIQY